LGFHVWPHGADDPDHADELRLDLDPQPGTTFAEARVAATELDDVDPDELTVASVPSRLERDGDPWGAIDDAPQSLEPLLALHERDRANGLLDAPWPPVYPKQPDEPPRVAPSRARRPE
jgi:DNA primase